MEDSLGLLLGMRVANHAEDDKSTKTMLRNTKTMSAKATNYKKLLAPNDDCWRLTKTADCGSLRILHL